jgi:hypothetical protein
MAYLNNAWRRIQLGETIIRGLVAACSLLVALGGMQAARAEAEDGSEALERQVKAAFLYKFAGYVEWPEANLPRPDTPITIGVLGADTLAAELSRLVAGRTVNNRAITAKRLKPGDSLAGINVLFIGKEETARLSQLLPVTRPRAILTVTESEGALAQGSVINFTIVERRVRFEISLDSAEKSGLKLSSRLLTFAQQVYTGNP